MKGIVFAGMLLGAALVAASALKPGLAHYGLSLWMGGVAWTLRAVGAGVRKLRRTPPPRAE